MRVDGMPHVLVVDDETALADIIGAYLEANGYRITVANDGQEALALDARDPADAVITDFAMPGMNGRDLVADLRRRRPDLPAIMVSGYVGMQQLDLHPLLLLNKPVSLAILTRHLRDLLDSGTSAR
ncbi:response regulator [Noviherbaspirillum sp. 1P10PC]|uniref:response regulator n=1 Tax=Noviherbaspirillum sp. 1P10PC TaxID=3132292 RepID=UPI0039A04235